MADGAPQQGVIFGLLGYRIPRRHVERFIMLRTSAALALVPLALGCATGGVEGFFVDLYGRVVDEGDAPAAGVEVTLETLDGALLGSATADGDGWYAIPVLADEWKGHQLHAEAAGDGYMTSEAWFDLDLVEGDGQLLEGHPPQTWSLWSRQLPALWMAFDASQGYVEGEIVDAQTGGPPEETDAQGNVHPLQFSLELRAGWNAPSGETMIAEVQTGAGENAGQFDISGLPPGIYTAHVPEFTGFSGARFPLRLASSGLEIVRAAVSKPLSSEELRVSLFWNETPADLNLHVTGPKAITTSGEDEWERFHIYAGSDSHPPNATEDHDRIAAMELLEENGMGPETAGVYELRDDGPYRFSVFDFSNAAISESEALASSRALLQLWIGSQEPQFFEITPGLSGDNWIGAEWDPETGAIYRWQELTDVDTEEDPGNF